MCCHQMSQPGGTVKHLITWVSALFSKEHFSRTWYAGWAQAVTAAVFTWPCEMHASSAVGVLGVSVVLIM